MSPDPETDPAGAPGALPFLEAVAAQLAVPLEVGGRAARPAGEREATRRAADLLRLAGSDPERAGALLAGDPVLLAVVFQNVDLLYAAGYPDADALSLAVMHALGLLEERPAG